MTIYDAETYAETQLPIIDGDFFQLEQIDDGLEFADEIGEYEEFAPGAISEENVFLFFILLVMIILGIVMIATRNKRIHRGLDSQVTKYRSLNAHRAQIQIV